MSLKRQALLDYIDNYLEVSLFKDYAPNGLQVEGREEVQTIVCGVTASLSLIEQAVSLNADALIVHHGYFWKGEREVITGLKKKRIAKLLEHDINLLAYHLPLDCHKLIGNNASIASELSMIDVKAEDIGKNKNLLWHGQLQASMSPEDFLTLCQKHYSPISLHLPAMHNREIKKIAWCSGAAQDYIEQAAALGVDAFLSGEVSERTTHLARELDVHYFACGHHATERQGIKSLGHHLADKFQLDCHFIDIPNPV